MSASNYRRCPSKIPPAQHPSQYASPQSSTIENDQDCLEDYVAKPLYNQAFTQGDPCPLLGLIFAGSLISVYAFWFEEKICSELIAQVDCSLESPVPAPLRLWVSISVTLESLRSYYSRCGLGDPYQPLDEAPTLRQACYNPLPGIDEPSP